MGLESRDWYREESRRASTRSPRVSLGAGFAAACICALLLVLSPTVRARLGFELPFGLERVTTRETPGALAFRPWPMRAAPARPLYAKDDPWRAWLADERTCPGGEDADRSAASQTLTLLCLANYARQRERLRPLSLSRVLSKAAAVKAADIERCGKFEHKACGKPAAQAARDVGYGGSFGENLYVANGPFVVPRVALDQWLNSPGHRENLFRPEWRTIGIALRSDVDVEQFRSSVVWVNEFGE
jgi:uncharacterized protein YkwD